MCAIDAAAELAQAPDRPLGKVNKALIALLAANHVVRVSNHVCTARLTAGRCVPSKYAAASSAPIVQTYRPW